MSDMAVSACVSGPVFGDTVYGVQSQKRLFYLPKNRKYGEYLTMKTICPHCGQGYPEIPDEYLGMTLQCSVCHKEFVCENAKFCFACGTINYANAMKCFKCGNFFQTMPQQPIADQKYFPYGGAPKNENIPWYKRSVSVKKEKIEYEANAWGVLAIFLSLGACFIPILTLPAIIYALLVHASKGQRYFAIAIVVLRMIAIVIFESSMLG